MNRFLVLCSSFMLIAGITRAQKTVAAAPRPQVIAYYAGSVSKLDSIDVSRLDQLIFCFGHLQGVRFHLDEGKDTVMIRKMVSLKSKNPKMKVLLSLGGWGGCETCSDAFSTDAGRAEFVASVKEISAFFRTDGIDLDWEYPTIRLDNDVDTNPVHKNTPDDKASFTDLVRKLRRELGPEAMVTFAAGGFDTYLTGSIDWAAVMPEVNYVNLMTYDLINGYAAETGHHTALYSTPKQKESTDNCVQYLLKIGVDPAKLIIGAAFYSRIFKDVPPKDHGLYQSCSFKGGVDYRDFARTFTNATGWETFWDNTAKAPYSYNAKEKLFATYDDKRSIAEKSRYVLQHKLGGIMFWELSHDTYTDGLVPTILKTFDAKK